MSYYQYQPPHGPPPSQYYTPPPNQPPATPYGQVGYGAPGGFGPMPTAGSPYPPPGQGYTPSSGPPSGQYNAPSGPPPIPGNRPLGHSSSYYTPPPGPPPNSYAPPPQQYQAPPQQYQAPPGPPPQQYHAPPPQQHYNHPPQPPAYNKPPPTQVVTYLGAIIPTSPNSVAPSFDPAPHVERIRKATKGFGTDETALINTLAPLDALQVDTLSKAFQASTGKKLTNVLEKETSSWFQMGLVGIAEGPLNWDVELLRRAVSGVGTHEDLLNELLLCRSSQDLYMMKRAYEHKYHRSLEDEVRGDLSMKTKQMFTMVLAAQCPPDNAPVDHRLVEADVRDLYKAGQGRMGTDEITFCNILINRSHPHLVALSTAYKSKHSTTLSKAIKKEFSGHMKDALLYIAEGAKRNDAGIWRDAKLLEKAMAGLGTKDERLVWRIVRAHWDRNRFAMVKEAYQHKYKKSLASRVKGETSGDYRKLMLAIIG